MANFRYKAMTNAGSVVSGTLDAPSKAAAIQQLRHLLLRQVLEAAARGDPRVDELGGADAAIGDGHGRISIGMFGRVSSQTSSMSSLVRAMQPSVQSALR